MTLKFHCFLSRNLPPSPRAIVIDSPKPPPRTSSVEATNVQKDQMQPQKSRHVHHNGPSSGDIFLLKSLSFELKHKIPIQVHRINVIISYV